MKPTNNNNSAPSSGETNNNNMAIPLGVVKSVVLSVLAKQGVPNPSDEVINKAIEEYYAQNA